MKKIPLLIGVLLLVGCEEKPQLDEVVQKVKDETTLTEAEQCVVDFTVSSAVDNKNLMTYAATLDVISRWKISELTEHVNYCRPMLAGAKNSDLLDKMTGPCSEKLKALSLEEVEDLFSHLVKLQGAASNFSGSVFELALGSCVK